MPASPSTSSFDSTPIQARADPAAVSSEAASLQGQPAKTPIIAGSVCGGVLFIAWLVGLFVYIRKRNRRKRQKRAAEEGLCEPPPEKINPARSNSERIVIPPDPAILLGYAKAGDIAHPAAVSRTSTESVHGKHSGLGALGLGHHRSHSSRKTPLSHSRSGSAHSDHGKESKAGSSHSASKEVPPVPHVPLTSVSGSSQHKKSHSNSSLAKSRPSSPRKTTDVDDEMTVPLNPHETSSA